MNTEQQKETNRIIVCGVLGIITMVYLALIGCVNVQHFNYKMNSDIGAEAVLARLIWNSGEMVPSTWISSTETRIIATPQLAALFYGWTGDMNLGLGLACCVMTTGILLAIWCFMKKAGFRTESCLLMCVLSLALSGNMTILELLYLFASYYGIHVITFFFIMNCYVMLICWSDGEYRKYSIFHLDREDGSTVENRLKLKVRDINNKSIGGNQYGTTMIVGKVAVSLLLAFLLGMQGSRGILITFGPLFGIEVIRILYRWITIKTVFNRNEGDSDATGKKTKVCSNWMVSFWVTGLLMLSFLGMKTPFATGQDISRNIRGGLSKLFGVVLADTYKAIGFESGNLLRNIGLAVLVLCVCGQVVRLLVKMLQGKALQGAEWCFLVTAASPVVAAVMVAFTTIESSERYYFMWIFAMALAVMFLWEQTMVCKEEDKDAMRGECSVRSVRGVFSMIGVHRTGLQEVKKVVGVLGVLISLIVSAMHITTVYSPILKAQEPTPSDALEVVRYLEINGYTEAYSTFESANRMTALSDGRINVYALNSFENLDMCQWLTSREWYPEDGIADQSETICIVPEERLAELDGLKEKGVEYDSLEQVGSYWIIKLL